MDSNISAFLSAYSDEVQGQALRLREILLAAFPGITEQVDLPARMIAYCYSQTYAGLLCTIIPSKKGLKLGFNRGIDLPDPAGLLEGSGKISRYVVIKSAEQLGSPELRRLLDAAMAAYRDRVTGTGAPPF